jgi:hypothetical protein
VTSSIDKVCTIGPLLDEEDELELEEDEEAEDEDEDEDELEELDDGLEDDVGGIDEDDEEEDCDEEDCEDVDAVVLEPREVAYAMPPTAAIIITTMTTIAAVLETADTFFLASIK